MHHNRSEKFVCLSAMSVFPFRSPLRRLFRYLCYLQPKVRCCLDHVEEGIEVNRLAQIAVCMKLIGFANIVIRFGTREHCNGNQARVAILFDALQQFAGIGFGQIEIKKDQIGPWRSGESALTQQKSKRLFAVFRHMYGRGRLQFPQGFVYQPHVPGIILNDEHIPAVASQAELSPHKMFLYDNKKS